MIEYTFRILVLKLFMAKTPFLGKQPVGSPLRLRTRSDGIKQEIMFLNWKLEGTPLVKISDNVNKIQFIFEKKICIIYLFIYCSWEVDVQKEQLAWGYLVILCQRQDLNRETQAHSHCESHSPAFSQLSATP